MRRRAASRSCIVLAAEGTRTRGEYWKSGFWRLARAAKLPIVLAFIDGPSRTSGFGPTITATSDVVADMDQVRAFYADKHGIHPERRTEPRLREELTAGGERAGLTPVSPGSAVEQVRDVVVGEQVARVEPLAHRRGSRRSAGRARAAAATPSVCTLPQCGRPSCSATIDSKAANSGRGSIRWYWCTAT